MNKTDKTNSTLKSRNVNTKRREGIKMEQHF